LVKKAIKEMKEIGLIIENWKKASLKEIEKIKLTGLLNLFQYLWVIARWCGEG